MLQSLSKKEYPENTFDSFGLLIVDEVHHISSEVFSQALLKTSSEIVYLILLILLLIVSKLITLMLLNII